MGACELVQQHDMKGFGAIVANTCNFVLFYFLLLLFCFVLFVCLFVFMGNL